MFWLSFADPDMPKGSQFLGVAIVRASNPEEAIKECWKMKINPGGQVAFMEIELDKYKDVPIEAINKLLSMAEIKKHFPDSEVMKWNREF